MVATAAALNAAAKMLQHDEAELKPLEHADPSLAQQAGAQISIVLDDLILAA